MKKLFVLILFFIPFTLLSQKSSFGEKLMPHFGIAFELFGIEGTTPNPGVSFTGKNFQIWGASLGTYYILTQSNDVFSLGIDPNIQAGIYTYFDHYQFGISTTTWLIQAPVFLMGRVGAMSTKYNPDNLGFGLGLGLIYSQIKEVNFGDTRQLDFSTSYISPAFMAEFTFIFAKMPLSLRLHKSISGHIFDAPYIANTFLHLSPVSKTLNNMGLSLIYGFR